jgi:hypothetical protein
VCWPRCLESRDKQRILESGELEVKEGSVAVSLTGEDASTWVKEQAESKGQM